jgi:hypothetical protein
MPKQTGFLKLEGTYGDVTFVRTADGFLAKQKTHISASRIKSDKRFQRTRENNAEFANAAKAGKLLRTAINELLQEAKDAKVTSRLTTVMLAVAKSDPESDRGQRTVSKGNVSLLEKFDFNINGQIKTAFKPEVETAVDRSAGVLKINVPAFVPKKSVTIAEGATHFKIVSAAVEVDFDAGTYVVNTSETESLLWDANSVAPITLTNSVTPASTKPLFLLMGIQFMQKVNGKDYPLQTLTFNALSIIKATKD